MNHLSGLARSIDVAQFARFFGTGVAATLVNAAMMWISRHHLPYSAATVVGLVGGMTVSFSLSKMFAFRSRSLRGTHVELFRFLLVYGLGSMGFWLAAMSFGGSILPMLMPRRLAELAGTLIGAGVMMVSSYTGHRLYTFNPGAARAGALA